jgi:putative Ca2+/H+ antiporter (TMEM165/GDT1 family)
LGSEGLVFLVEELKTMTAFLKSLIFVFLSEMGDKTQIVSFAFGTNYSLRVVLVGVFIAVATLMGLTVALGTAVSAVLPVFWINIASGVLFCLFGVLALKKHDEAHEKTFGQKFGPLVAVMITFFLAELGDKTVFASMAMGSQFHDYLPVWAGSTAGMYLADLIAIIGGRVLGKQLPDKLVRYGSAAIFIVAGLYTIFGAFTVPVK